MNGDPTPALPYLSGSVYFDDGRTWHVDCDQRDQRRAMLGVRVGGAGIVDAGGDPLGWLRACAWACLTRRGELDVTWPDFDAQCSFVVTDSEPTMVDPSMATAP